MIIEFINKFKNRYLLLFLLFIIVIFSAYFSYLSIKRVYSFNSYYYDLGIMEQVVYNSSRGRILEMTNQTFDKNMNRLAIHFDPILVMFAPFYRIFPHFSILLIFQSLINGLGALAIFLLGKKIIKNEKISFLFSLFYLLNFQNQRAILFDFHSVVLSTSFFLFAAYFYEIKKYFWFFFFIFLSLLTKEHVGLIVFFFGLYLLVFRRNLRIGFFTVFLGSLFFIVTNNWLIPYFRQDSHFALKYFSDFGFNQKEIFFSLIKRPDLIINKIFSLRNFKYHQRLLLGNSYSFFSPLVYLIAFPEYLINLLSSNGNMRSYYFHYQSIIIAFSFYSLIKGYRNFYDLVKNKIIRLFVFFMFLLGNVYLFYHYSPLPYFTKEPVNYQINKNQLLIILNWANKLKDENIKLATTPKLAPFFTHRIFYLDFLYDSSLHSQGYSDEEIFIAKKSSYRQVNYVIIYKREIKTKAAKKIYQQLLEDKNYHLIFNQNEIEVFKKI